MAKTQQQIDDERKENEYRDLMQLSQYSPLIKIKALDAGRGHPPTRYEIVYTCRGKLKTGGIGNRFLVRMTLPAIYPRDLPDFRCVDPPTIDHPHILGDWICIGHEHGMPVGLPLREYVIGAGQMIQWQKDTEGRGGPVDNRPLVGKEPEPERPQPAIPTQTALPPRPSRPDEEPLIIVVEESQPTAPLPVSLQPTLPRPEAESISIVVEDVETESGVIVLDDDLKKTDEGTIVINVLDE